MSMKIRFCSAQKFIILQLRMASRPILTIYLVHLSMGLFKMASTRPQQERTPTRFMASYNVEVTNLAIVVLVAPITPLQLRYTTAQRAKRSGFDSDGVFCTIQLRIFLGLW